MRRLTPPKKLYSMLAGEPVSLAVTSATSEDLPTHAAANLSLGRPWRCDNGDLYARIELALVPPSPIAALIIGNSNSSAIMMHACSRRGNFDRRGWIGSAPPRFGHAEQGDAIQLLPLTDLSNPSATLAFKAGHGRGKLNHIASTQEWTHILIDVYGSHAAGVSPGLRSVQLLRPATEPPARRHVTTSGPFASVAVDDAHMPPSRQQSVGRTGTQLPRPPPPPPILPPRPHTQPQPPKTTTTSSQLQLPPTRPAGARPPHDPSAAACLAPAMGSQGSSSSGTAGPQDATPTLPSCPPRCVTHQREALRAYVKKAGKHFGRPVWVCSLPKGESCGFVGWAARAAAAPASSIETPASTPTLAPAAAIPASVSVPSVRKSKEVATDAVTPAVGALARQVFVADSPGLTPRTAPTVEPHARRPVEGNEEEGDAAAEIVEEAAEVREEDAMEHVVSVAEGPHERVAQHDDDDGCGALGGEAHKRRRLSEATTSAVLPLP